VRLWSLQHKAAPAPARADYRVCTQQLPAGVLAGVCAGCAEAGLTFAGVAAI
jgi:hypothetical protein